MRVIYGLVDGEACWRHVADFRLGKNVQIWRLIGLKIDALRFSNQLCGGHQGPFLPLNAVTTNISDTREMPMFEEDDVEIDSVIHAQLYGISRISQAPQRDYLKGVFTTTTLGHTDQSPYRSFSASHLVDLLQQLDIPYLKHDDWMIQAPSNVVGRGGFAEVKYESGVTSFYGSTFKRQPAAIKDLSLHDNTTEE